MLVVHGTKKLRDRVGGAPHPPGEPTSLLGRWYATAIVWRPQLALFVHHTTLLPVLMPLAPAATVLGRFPDRLARVLALHGLGPDTIEAEVTALGEQCLTTTASRSIVGVMNEFTFLADAYGRPTHDDEMDELAMRLAQTPCGPLYKSHVSPDRALLALLDPAST